MKRLILSAAALLSIPLWAQEIVPANPADQAMAQLAQETQNPQSKTSVLVEAVKKTSQDREFGSWLEKELVKYRIRFRINALGFLSDEDSNPKADFYYERHVEPAFRNNEQVRRDVWNLPMTLTSGSFTASAQVRLTYTRYFSGADAKRKALFADFKWPWELIQNSNDVKLKMKDNEGFRFEVSGDLAVGPKKEYNKSNLLADIGAYYKRGARFIVDILKIKPTMARMRFIGLKNRGEIGVDAAIRIPEILSMGGKLAELANIGIGYHGQMSFSPFEPLTFDTMMIDYLFHFSTPEPLDKNTLSAQPEIAESAMEEIFRNVKRGGFASIFMFFYESSELTKDLLSKASLAEKFSKEDMPKYKTSRDPKDIRVFTYFKGKMLSHYRSGELKASLSGLIGGSSRSGQITSHVTSHDGFEVDEKMNQKVEYFWLDNSFLQHKSRALFGRNQYNMTNDLDVLVLSDAQKNVGDLSDVIVKTQIEDTSLSKKDMADYKKIVSQSVPTKYQNHPIFAEIFKDKDQTNAFLGYTLSFGDLAFRQISQDWGTAYSMNENGVRRYDRIGEAHQMYIDFIESHPDKAYMNLPAENLPTYTEGKTQEVLNIFQSKAKPGEYQGKGPIEKQRLEAFKVAKMDPNFQLFTVNGFFSKLLPQQNPDPFFGFEIKFSSYESGTKSSAQYPAIGDNKVSRVYDSVALIRSVINDQALDLQMVSGMLNGLPTPANQIQLQRTRQSF